MYECMQLISSDIAWVPLDFHHVSPSQTAPKCTQKIRQEPNMVLLPVGIYRNLPPNPSGNIWKPPVPKLHALLHATFSVFANHRTSMLHNFHVAPQVY